MSIYDYPFKYNRKADAYVVTIKGAEGTRFQVSLADRGGDRALPHGVVLKMKGDKRYHTYLYAPGYSARDDKTFAVGSSDTKQEAIEDVRRAIEQGLAPRIATSL